MKALAHQHGAALATFEGRLEEAIAGFEAAAAAFEAIGLRLRTALCQARALELRTGEVQVGHDRLRALGVVAPATFLDAYAPGRFTRSG
jgi:hypothetical protein